MYSLDIACPAFSCKLFVGNVAYRMSNARFFPLHLDLFIPKKLDGEMPLSKHQSRANAYKRAILKGKLKSVRSDLVYKYGLSQVATRMGLPVRPSDDFECLEKVDFPGKLESGDKMLRAVMRYYGSPEFQQINQTALLANKAPLGLIDLAQQLGLKSRVLEQVEHQTLDKAVQQIRG